MAVQYLRVGILAKRSGVSVRTLRHYDAINLLKPSHHNAAGYRFYALADVQRLQHVRALQSLGFSLAAIATELLSPVVDGNAYLLRYITQIDARIAEQTALKLQLLAIINRNKAGESATLSELLSTLETMKMIEKYYTPEQMEQMRALELAIGPERIAQVQARWPDLIAAVKAKLAVNTPPSDTSMKILAQEWMQLVNEMTAGDSGIQRSIMTMYQNEAPKAQMNAPQIPGSSAPVLDPDMPKLFVYIQQAMKG